MRYLPKSPADREEMLREIGVGSIADLFATIPAEYQLTRDLKVPRQHSESEIVDRFREFAEKNATGYASFLGAGVYRHYKPVIIDSLVLRGEFLTSYTPYQPEISQGTLQAMFEFQTMICELTGMEIANASMYDGSTGAAEAMMMAVRVTGRDKAVIARTVHPEYREVIRTYAQHQEIPIAEVSYAAIGRVDMAALDAKPGDNRLIDSKAIPVQIILTVEKHKSATEFEWHENRDHIVQIVDGSTLYEVGGTPKGTRSIGPGEFHATGSEGSKSILMVKGDMLVIPRGTLHKRSTEDSVTFMLISNPNVVK